MDDISIFGKQDFPKRKFDGLYNQPISFHKSENGECLYKHHVTSQKGNFDGLVSIVGEQDWLGWVRLSLGEMVRFGCIGTR